MAFYLAFYLASILTYFLAFYLAPILAYFLAFDLASTLTYFLASIQAFYSGIYAGILKFGIYSDILSGILSGIYSDILSGILSGIYLTFSLASGPAVPTEIWHQRLRPRNAH